MVLSDVAPGETRAAAQPDHASTSRRPSAPGRDYLASREPWSARNGVISLILAVAGAVVVALCWYGGSDERTAEDQAGWLTGGLLGTALFALGGAVWVISGFRAVRLGMRELAADKRAFALGGDVTLASAAVSAPSDVARSGSGAGLVIGPGMVRAHRADCLLVLGKQVRAVGPADDGVEGCGVCLP